MSYQPGTELNDVLAHAAHLIWSTAAAQVKLDELHDAGDACLGDEVEALREVVAAVQALVADVSQASRRLDEWGDAK